MIFTFPAEKTDGQCMIEIREMSPGSYSLCSNNDPVLGLEALEVSIFFNCPTEGIESECGGFLSYVPRNETEEVSTLVFVFYFQQ
jgi:hypothetical protein